MKHSSFIFCLFISFATSIFAQDLDQLAQQQDSTLYCQIQNRVLGFKCTDPSSDVTEKFAGYYAEITGNSRWWLVEKKCDEQTYCPMLMNASPEGFECGLTYTIPAEIYDRKKITSYSPVKYGNCLEAAKKELTNYEWVRDYPLFLNSLNTKNKKFYEQESLWWVARYKSNPSQTQVDQQIQKLKNYHFVFLSGITATEQNESTINTDFQSLKSWMTQNGISNELLVTQYNYPPEANRPIIQEKITKLFDQNKKIIFITHSKGGLDLAYFLLKSPHYWNAFISPIKGWVALQMPFWGTTNAQDCLADSKIRKLLYVYQKLENLSDSATAMIAPRTAFNVWCNKDNSPKPEVENLLNSNHLKILEVKTWTERFNELSGNDKGLSWLKAAGLKLKSPTDAYVWMPCTNMPCVDYVSLEGFHHWDLTKPEYKKFGPNVYYDSVPFFRALLEQLLQ